MNLVGTWVVDRTDRRALAEFGDVLLEFREDCTLTYVVRGRDRDQIIKLRYQIDGNTIITDQPSVPRVAHMECSLCDDGVLTLTFEGVPCRFIRWQPNRESCEYE